MIRIAALIVVVISFLTFPFWITLLVGVGYTLYYQSPEVMAVGIFFDALTITGDGVHGFTFFFTIIFAITYFLTLLLRERFVGYTS